MPKLYALVAVSLLVGLSGCGSKKVEKKENKARSMPSTVMPGGAPNVSTPPAATPLAQDQKAAPLPATAPDAAKGGAPALKPISADTGEFGADMASGKPIRVWIEMLSSKIKAEQIEACGALGIARGRSVAALPKLQELAKSADAEIKAEAEDAIAKINAK